EVLQFFIEELNLTHCGIIRSPVSEAELAAYYRRADAFVTLSEHEGFCVPLLEAMAFEKPILARACGAVPGTLEDAGLMIGPDDFSFSSMRTGGPAWRTKPAGARSPSARWSVRRLTSATPATTGSAGRRSARCSMPTRCRRRMWTSSVGSSMRSGAGVSRDPR